jgi:hypothetical protein
MTEGEAKLILRSALTQDGIGPRQRLCCHHNRRTMARVPSCGCIITEGMLPKPVKDIGQSISSILTWRGKWGLMDRVSENYEKVKQRVIAWAAEKAAANGPTPMDIGEVDGYRCEECEAAAVNSSMRRHICGDWGHASRSFPSETKGGKGGKEREV